MIGLNFVKLAPTKFVVESPLSDAEIKQIATEVFPQFFILAHSRYHSLNLDAENLKDLKQNTIVFAYEILSHFDKTLIPVDSNLNETALIYLTNKFNFSFADLVSDLERQGQS